ncbi:MAG: prolyl oligopeptidase family serine peptidase [Candidatus Dependentiae bacterium]|nr:prolyl oligopeptidase family serine peptidase [Candidatus Dependentiae bacterium]
MKKLLNLIFFFTSFSAYSAECTIFAHGIVDGPTQVVRFQEAIATSKTLALSFPDAHPASGCLLNGIIGYLTNCFGKKVNRDAMFMGQSADIATIVETMSDQTSCESSVILYGCSRGAAAIINYMSQCNPTQVKALVLDACPASISETIAPTLAKLGINPSLSLSVFTTIFPAYPENSITPRQAIKNIANKNLPILLIHGKSDTVVPYEHSLMLYLEFKKQGFTNVHLVTISQGKHSFLLQNEYAKSQYLTAVHSFYKAYGLSHDPTWAKDTCDTDNPDFAGIAEKISIYETNILRLHEYGKKRNLIAIASLVTIMSLLYLKNHRG